VQFLPFRTVVVMVTAFAFFATVEVASADGGSSAGGAGAYQAEALYVKRGHRGPGVRLIQRKLGLTADGVFGRVTERTVRSFQRREGLVADGIVGPQTRKALGIAHMSRRSVYRRSRGSRGSTRLPRVMRRIAECESGGDPTAVSANGRYRGKWQFSRATWRRLGGTGDPAEASEALQDKLAMKLYRQEGTDPWPVCGKS
jgi:Transglycosylase-like domain/Putative peptidoglycan binding domain